MSHNEAGGRKWQEHDKVSFKSSLN